jgi:methionine sulfoxide reductase heme-binding subunit
MILTDPKPPSLPMQIWNSPYLFWLLLAIPALPMLGDIYASHLRGVLRESGEFAARFMIIAMALTPLVMLFPRFRPLRWLVARRRAIGVAAFCYGALHLLAYLLKEKSLVRIWGEIDHIDILTGWIAFLIFVPLALTSNDWFVRAMKQNWKTLQRLVYAAALATVAHWYFLEYEVGPALVHFAPLALLETYRIGRNLKLIPGPARQTG